MIPEDVGEGGPGGAWGAFGLKVKQIAFLGTPAGSLLATIFHERSERESKWSHFQSKVWKKGINKLMEKLTLNKY